MKFQETSRVAYARLLAKKHGDYELADGLRDIIEKYSEYEIRDNDSNGFLRTTLVKPGYSPNDYTIRL